MLEHCLKEDDFLDDLIHNHQYESPMAGLEHILQTIEGSKGEDLQYSMEQIRRVLKFLEPIKKHRDYKNLYARAIRCRKALGARKRKLALRHK